MPVPHLQVGEAAALVQVGEVTGEVHGVGRIDVAVGSGARRSGCCTRAGLLCRWRHSRLFGSKSAKADHREIRVSELHTVNFPPSDRRTLPSATFHARRSKQLVRICSQWTQQATSTGTRYRARAFWCGPGASDPSTGTQAVTGPVRSGPVRSGHARSQNPRAAAHWTRALSLGRIAGVQPT